MTTEDITDIITRRLDAVVKELAVTELYEMQKIRDLRVRMEELRETLAEIQALKENETKNNQVN